MFQEFKIAQAIHAERDARLAGLKQVEGMTVEKPNIIDRAVRTMRAILDIQSSKQRTPLVQHNALAK